MTFFHIAVLAVIQGITEFLPISSSGHLVLIPTLTGWQDQGLMIDVAVHVGTLIAVIIYFWRDVLAMAGGTLDLLRGRSSRGGLLAGLIIIGTVPLIIGGWLMNRYMPDGIRDLTIIAWATLGFGVLLFIIDRLGVTLRRMEHLNISDAVMIGIAQVLALIPGTSRSGITMTAARLLGMERDEAARFSMLLSIPAIIGAGTLKGLELYESGDAQLTAAAGLAAVLSLVVALIAIALMMAWLRRASFTPFVAYRVALGIVLLGYVYGYWG